MSADAGLLAMLEAVDGLNVWDGGPDVDETEKVISVDLPYVAFWSSTGIARGRRHSGTATGRVQEFSITGVGEDRHQAKWALDRAREALEGKRLGGNLIKHTDDSRVRRDDDFTRPGGGPLFYGVDQYAVAT